MGILGGTFNPPHNGHLELAKHARRELGLGAVLLMPAHTPPHKPPLHDGASPEQRLAMCELATAEVDGVRACELEVLRGGPSYTVDTLSEVHDADPGASLTLIMGADVALTLPAWRHPGALLELAQIAIAKRDGDWDESSGKELSTLVATLEADGAHVSVLQMPPIDVSSSIVRERVAEGLPVDGLVPQGVAKYIAAHKLYTKDGR